jgi:hypothetical protein
VEGDWGLNSGLCACKAGALPPVCFALVILEMVGGSQELFAWSGLKLRSF